MLPDGVAVVEATPDMFETPALPEEEATLGRPVGKRLREFRAGRAAARAALSRLSVPPTALSVGPRRAPAWPVGVVGTIVHCEGLAAAAVARRSQLGGLGLDAEPEGRVQDHLVPRVATDAERVWSASHPDAGTALFVVKEAAYKALSPRYDVFLDFRQVCVEPFTAGPEVSPFVAHVVDGALAHMVVRGCVVRSHGLVLAGASIPVGP